MDLQNIIIINIVFVETKTKYSRQAQDVGIMNRRSGYRVSDNQTPSILPGSSVEYDLEEKVFRLQESLNTFRSEVDMKMKIMEQVLTSRSGKLKGNF